MALRSDYLAALIDLRVAELRELAARTAVEFAARAADAGGAILPHLAAIERRPAKDLEAAYSMSCCHILPRNTI